MAYLMTLETPWQFPTSSHRLPSTPQSCDAMHFDYKHRAVSVTSERLTDVTSLFQGCAVPNDAVTHVSAVVCRTIPTLTQTSTPALRRESKNVAHYT